MGNASSHQLNYWFKEILKTQKIRYCVGCHRLEPEVFLILDRIDGTNNHNILGNTVHDFQILCVGCNRIKNPHIKKPTTETMTNSEITNHRAEKPMMRSLLIRLKKGEIINYRQWVADSSKDFDCSVKTIRDGYYEKYFIAIHGPFELYSDHFDNSLIRLKKDYDPI